jgi:Tfp pilus assembly protein PilW
MIFQANCSQEGRYHIQRQAENESSTSTAVAKASSSTTVEIVLATEPAAYTTDYITLQSGDTAAYGSAFTTIYYDLPASTTETPPEASASTGNSSSHKYHQ